MNTTHVKLSPAVLLTFVLLLCNLSAIARPQEKIKKKEISQSYSVSAGDRLQVENRYGNITVTHWNQNTVAIRVEVECKARRSGPWSFARVPADRSLPASGIRATKR